jgi:hypothetical protein
MNSVEKRGNDERILSLSLSLARARALYAYLLPSEGERSACKESEEIAQIMAIVGFVVVVVVVLLLLVFECGKEANFLPNEKRLLLKNKPIKLVFVFSREWQAKLFFFFSFATKKCVRVLCEININQRLLQFLHLFSHFTHLLLLSWVLRRRHRPSPRLLRPLLFLLYRRFSCTLPSLARIALCPFWRALRISLFRRR